MIAQSSNFCFEMARTNICTSVSFLVRLQCFPNGFTVSYDQNVCNDWYASNSEISIIDIRIREIHVIVYLGTKN